MDLPCMEPETESLKVESAKCLAAGRQKDI